MNEQTSLQSRFGLSPLPGLPTAAVLVVLAVTFSVSNALGDRADGLYLLIPLAAVLGTAINLLLQLGYLPRRMYGALFGVSIPAAIGLSMLLNFSLDHLWLPLLFVWLAAGSLRRPSKRRRKNA